MLIVQCMWVASTRYELEFESDDIFHLGMKGVHVLALVGVGATSSTFTMEGRFLRSEQEVRLLTYWGLSRSTYCAPAPHRRFVPSCSC